MKIRVQNRDPSSGPEGSSSRYSALSSGEPGPGDVSALQVRVRHSPGLIREGHCIPDQEWIRFGTVPVLWNKSQPFGPILPADRYFSGNSGFQNRSGKIPLLHHIPEPCWPPWHGPQEAAQKVRSRKTRRISLPLLSDATSLQSSEPDRSPSPLPVTALRGESQPLPESTSKQAGQASLIRPRFRRLPNPSRQDH